MSRPGLASTTADVSATFTAARHGTTQSGTAPTVLAAVRRARAFCGSANGASIVVEGPWGTIRETLVRGEWRKDDVEEEREHPVMRAIVDVVEREAG